MEPSAAPPAAVKFWEAIIARDRDAAIRNVASLEVPLVEASPFDFEEDSPRSGETIESGVLVGEGTSAAGESIIPSTSPLMADTPSDTITAWNSDNDVKVVVLKADAVCGVRVVVKGEKDYLVCALPLVGADRCKVGTHAKRREKSGLDISLPLGGTPGLAILVRGSSQAKPRVFSRPVLPYTDFPISMRGEDVMGLLTSLNFPARVWKLLFEVHGGYDWMEDLANPPAERRGNLRANLPLLNIPSPRVGAGGYDPSGFEAYEDDPQDEEGGNTSPTPQSQSNPNPPSESYPTLSQGVFNTSGAAAGDMLNSPHESFNTANEGGLNSPPPVFASRVYNPREIRRATLDLPDDLSSALTLEPDSRALRGSVEKLKGRVRFLENVLTERDTANASSFAAMRAELDDMWESVHGANSSAAEGLALGNEALSQVNDLAIKNSRSSASVARDMSAILDQIGSDDIFRGHLLRLVMEDMDKSKFITLESLEDKLSRLSSSTTPPPSVSPAELSGVSTRLAKAEQALFKPEGIMAALTARVKLMEDRKKASAVARGNQVFKDQQAVQAFVIASGDTAIYRYVVDMVSLLTLAPDPYFTVAEGMASEAAAAKAKFNSLLEARIALSYPITFPSSVMSKSTSTAEGRGLDLTNGWRWTHSWSSSAKFEGSFNNGAFDIMLSDLKDTKETVQNSIDSAFPIDTHGTMHAIFTEQLSISYEQAVGWLQSLLPLFKTMKSGGLTNDDAWTRVLVYTKSLFEDIKTVRHLTSDTKGCAAMIWGSMRTADLLAEYSRLRWIQHPQVSSILALTSMQTEGKALADTVATINTINRDVNKLSESWKKLKRENPTLKF